MPVVANSYLPGIESDNHRYVEAIAAGNYTQVSVFRDLDCFVGVDTGIETLAACNHIILMKENVCVYSCYYKHAVVYPFGNRAVQVEVRQSKECPGLARFMMHAYFMRRYDTLRTDISQSPAGADMWIKFLRETKANVYTGFLDIDLRSECGLRNQDANVEEQHANVKPFNAVYNGVWHDNKQKDVCVLYASNLEYP